MLTGGWLSAFPACWEQAAVRAKYGQGAVEDYLKDPNVRHGVAEDAVFPLADGHDRTRHPYPPAVDELGSGSFHVFG